MTDIKAVILHIFGRVQGVGFRFYTQKVASEMNINGWVRNLPDGCVYIEAEGEANNLQRFIEWCEEGPQWARVSTVQKQFVSPKGYIGFEIK